VEQGNEKKLKCDRLDRSKYFEHRRQKNRGVTDIFIACVDGLKGFPEAIESVFPQTEVHLCIVHLVRHSLNYVGWKQRKEEAVDLKLIYTAATDAEAEQRLDEFSLKWDAKFPMIAKSWRSNWMRVIPFVAHSPEIRRDSDEELWSRPHGRRSFGLLSASRRPGTRRYVLERYISVY
jgi:transposase-like protein